MCTAFTADLQYKIHLNLRFSELWTWRWLYFSIQCNLLQWRWWYFSTQCDLLQTNVQLPPSRSLLKWRWKQHIPASCWYALCQNIPMKTQIFTEMWSVNLCRLYLYAVSEHTATKWQQYNLPYLKFDFFPIQFNCSNFEIYTWNRKLCKWTLWSLKFIT